MQAEIICDCKVFDGEGRTPDKRQPNRILIQGEINMKNFTQKDIDEKFQSFKEYNEEDVQKVLDNEEKIEKIASDGPLSKYLEEIKLYFQMLHDIFTGKYKKVPVGTIAAIVGTLLYVIFPADLIPDLIPVVGYLDDAAVVAACLNATRFDLAEYKKYKKMING